MNKYELHDFQKKALELMKNHKYKMLSGAPFPSIHKRQNISRAFRKSTILPVVYIDECIAGADKTIEIIMKRVNGKFIMAGTSKNQTMNLKQFKKWMKNNDK